jgi:hypothetical protein
MSSPPTALKLPLGKPIPNSAGRKAAPQTLVQNLCVLGRSSKAQIGVRGTSANKASIEHLNRYGTFYWSDGLKEVHLARERSRAFRK